jgi:hypothetical protein
VPSGENRWLLTVDRFVVEHSTNIRQGLLSLARTGPLPGTHLRTSLGDLMDRTPRMLDPKHHEPLPRQLHEAVCGLDWVEAAEVRVREGGHVFCADVRLVPRDRGPDLVTRLTNASENLKRLDWRLREVRLVPVERLT